MAKDYEKLVRDRIPEIIRGQGSECRVSTLAPEAYAGALRAKLVEEAREAADAEGAELVTEWPTSRGDVGPHGALRDRAGRGRGLSCPAAGRARRIRWPALAAQRGMTIASAPQAGAEIITRGCHASIR